jgi:hypothetical protein
VVLEKDVAHAIVAHVKHKVTALSSLEIATGSLVFHVTQTVVGFGSFKRVDRFPMSLCGSLNISVGFCGVSETPRRDRTPIHLLSHVNVARV